MIYSTVSYVRCNAVNSFANLSYNFTITYRHPPFKFPQYSEYPFLLYEKIIDQREKGKAFDQIAEWLNKKGYLSVRGKKFKSNHVHSIIKKKPLKDEQLGKDNSEACSDFSLEVVDKTLVNTFENFLGRKSRKYMIYKIVTLINKPSRK